MRLKDKVCFVTGAASGIGQGAAVRFAKEGAKAVVIADLNAAGLEETEKQMQGTDAKIMKVGLDVRSEEQWIAAKDKAVGEFGTIDVLVNCAGIDYFGQFQDVALEDWNNIMATNATGTFLGCKHIAPVMMAQKAGSIVNISSAAGLYGTWGMLPYGASKGAVNLITQCVAAECAEYNVRANTVHPGNTWTPMVAKYIEEGSTMESLSSWSPMKRLATVEEQVNAILWLASDESTYTTGGMIPVEGGAWHIDYADHS